MKLHFFWIPAFAGEQSQAELNGLLARGRVLQMDRAAPASRRAESKRVLT